MAKKHKSLRPELLSRNLAFSYQRVSVHLHAVHHKGVEPYIERLELKGMASEPVRDVKDVAVGLYPEDKPVVGMAVCQLASERRRPYPVEIHVRPGENQVQFGSHSYNGTAGGGTRGISFTKPHYGSGLVVSASFSNEANEGEE